MIFNNDGSCWNYARAASAPEILRIATTGLEDSHVDTISYSTTETFNNYTHRTEVGEQYNDAYDILNGLREQGTDPLQIMIDFCRQHDKEILWSFRVNDEHDAWVSDRGGQWKREHQDCLFGTRDNPPPNASWSCVDYAQPAVRDLIFRTIEEVCTRYDVDGIELDFFRQLHCFRNHAWGEELGEQERQIMTAHLQRIRTMMDEIGQRRGRPLVLAARVPDCTKFARCLALDVQDWLERDLMDIMIVGGYFWLNPWEKSVALGRQYGVPVYTSLDASRVADDETRTLRRSDLGYRAHAANALHAGVDGIYVFNLNYMRDPKHRIWRELGDPEALAGLDKIYHVSVMGDGHPDVEFYVPSGRQYVNIPRLCPDHPLQMLPGQRFGATLKVADDVSATAPFTPRVSINVKVVGLGGPGDLTAYLNGDLLEPCPLSWRFESPGDWLEFLVEPAQVRAGDNLVELQFSGAPDKPACTVQDIHLRLEHGPNADRRRDLTMSRNRFLAYHDSAV